MKEIASFTKKFKKFAKLKSWNHFMANENIPITHYQNLIEVFWPMGLTPLPPKLCKNLLSDPNGGFLTPEDEKKI